MRLIMALLCTFCTVTLKAQPYNFKADLQALHSILQKTPSYKVQIRGEAKALYNAMVRRLEEDTAFVCEGYESFYRLAQLLFPLRDNHLALYEVGGGPSVIKQTTRDSSEKNNALAIYPRVNLNLDSLEAMVKNSPADSVAGIYYYDTLYSLALFKRSEKEYLGVVLHSNLQHWQPGQVAIHLFEYGRGLYKAIYRHPVTRQLILQPVEKYRNHSLVNSSFYSAYSRRPYTRQPSSPDYVNLTPGGSRFKLQNINEQWQYVLVKSFQANRVTMQQSDSLLNMLKTGLNAPYLLVDLRNNEGGSQREARKYIGLLRKYARKHTVYLLINNGTLSQAEKLTLRLKKLPNVVTVGQTTYGMLAYGSNYGYRKRLPGGKYEIYITDMRGKAGLLPYEDVGIIPDHLLKPGTDWITQVVTLFPTQQ